MKFSFMMHALAAAVVCSFLSCSNSASPGEAEWSKFTSDFYNGLAPAESLAAVKIPILRSPSYEAKWGKPEMRVSKGGNYELSYANPAQPYDRLVIYGSAVPYPQLAVAPQVSGESMMKGELAGVRFPQAFRTVTVAGSKVKWFQETMAGGADGAYYSTEGFTLRGPSGSNGYYRMVVEAGEKADMEVQRRFASGR